MSDYLEPFPQVRDGPERTNMQHQPVSYEEIQDVEVPDHFAPLPPVREGEERTDMQHQPVSYEEIQEVDVPDYLEPLPTLREGPVTIDMQQELYEDVQEPYQPLGVRDAVRVFIHNRCGLRGGGLVQDQNCPCRCESAARASKNPGSAPA